MTPKQIGNNIYIRLEMEAAQHSAYLCCRLSALQEGLCIVRIAAWEMKKVQSIARAAADLKKTMKLFGR